MWVSGWNKPWQSNAFFFSRPTLGAEASPGQTQCCSQGGRRLCGSVCFVGGQILFILKCSLLHGSYPSVLPLKLMCFSKTSCWNCITCLAFCLTVFWPHQGPIPVVTMFVSHQMDTKIPYYCKQSLVFFSFQEGLVISQEIWFGQTAGFWCWQNFQFWGTVALPPLISLTRIFSLPVSTPFLFVSDPVLLRGLSWQLWQNAILCAQGKHRGDTNKSRMSLSLLQWLSSSALEPLLMVKCLVKAPCLLSPKDFFSCWDCQ